MNCLFAKRIIFDKHFQPFLTSQLARYETSEMFQQISDQASCGDSEKEHLDGWGIGLGSMAGGRAGGRGGLRANRDVFQPGLELIHWNSSVWFQHTHRNFVAQVLKVIALRNDCGKLGLCDNCFPSAILKLHFFVSSPLIELFLFFFLQICSTIFPSCHFGPVHEQD